jgi:hypothetical protein
VGKYIGNSGVPGGASDVELEDVRLYGATDGF